MWNKAAIKMQVFWDKVPRPIVSLTTFRWGALPPYLVYALWTEQTMKMQTATPPQRQDNTVTNQLQTFRKKCFFHLQGLYFIDFTHTKDGGNEMSPSVQ